MGNKYSLFEYPPLYKRILHLLIIKPMSNNEILKRLRTTSRMLESSVSYVIRDLFDRHCVQKFKYNSIKIRLTPLGLKIFKELKKKPDKQNIKGIFYTFIHEVSTSNIESRYWIDLLKIGIQYVFNDVTYVYLKTAHFYTLQPTDYVYRGEYYGVKMKKDIPQIDKNVIVMNPVEDPSLFDRIKQQILTNKKISQRDLDNPNTTKMVGILTSFMNGNIPSQQLLTKVGKVSIANNFQILL